MYTTAVVVWKLLDLDKSWDRELGPCLHLYEGRSDSKWFPKAHPSTQIRKLYPKGDAYLYAVDEDYPYALATLLHADSELVKPTRVRGIILSE